MKKIFILLAMLLCILYAETEPIIIIYRNPTVEAKEIIKLNNLTEEETLSESTTINQNSEPESLQLYTPKKQFTYEGMNCAIEFPISWEFDTSSLNYHLVAFPYNKDDIMVTLQAYKSNEAITANGVYIYRSGIIWDRWQLLASKTFNPKESFLIGVNEKLSTIYKKQDLTEKLTFRNTVVAEDIYVKDQSLIYIVTAQAPEAVFKKYNQIIKDIMNSFYVSEDLNGKKL